MKIIFIGSGNVATHMASALKDCGHDIIQIYSRTLTNAQILADKLHCNAIDDLAQLDNDADAYIISTKDDAISGIAKTICTGRSNAVFIHTAGSVPMKIFEGYAHHYGVLYPMQTFSKGRKVDFRKIPCFIEAQDETAMSVVSTLANTISKHVRAVDSDKRRYLHLAAVFACNLTNHCYRLAEKTLQEQGLDFSLYAPLIEETANKVATMSPRDAQTGPMVRYDTGVMERQKSLIKDERTKQIYQIMADSIHEDACQSSRN